MIDETKKAFRSATRFSPSRAVRNAIAELKKRGRQPMSAEEYESARSFLYELGPRLVRSRRKISTQLYLAIAVIVALTVLASFVGWYSFDRVAVAQRHVIDESIPEMVAAFEVAQYSSSLVAAAPRIVTAQSVTELDETYTSISGASNSLESQLADLESRAVSADPHAEHMSLENIRSDSQLLTTNIKTIRNQRTELLVQAEKREVLREELADVRRRLEVSLVEALDDQLFYVSTGYRDIDQPPDPRSVHTAAQEVDYYRLLSELQVDGNIATGLLGNAFTVSEATSLEPLRERFEAAIGRIRLNLDSFEDSPVHAELAPIFHELAELGTSRGKGLQSPLPGIAPGGKAD